jgi:hypothetical protein
LNTALARSLLCMVVLSGLPLPAFDPASDRWQVLRPSGEPLPKPRWQSYKGFFHPQHNVYVLALGNEPVWVYRYQRRK